MEMVDDVVKEFLVESYENLDQLDRDLMALEETPDDKSRLSSVFRTIHTIKGTSSLSLPCVGESVGAAPFDSSFSGLTVSNRCQGDPMIVRLLDRGVTVAT